MPWFMGKKQVDKNVMEEEANNDDDNDNDCNVRVEAATIDGVGHDDSPSGNNDAVSTSSSSPEEAAAIVHEANVSNSKNTNGTVPPELSQHSEITEDVSLIDETSAVDSLDDNSVTSSSSSEEEEEDDDDDDDDDDSSDDEDGPDATIHDATTATIQNNVVGRSQQSDDGTENEDDDQVPASFWEKQSLLILAAEHDRVDILSSILTDEDGDKERLLNSGIPPLHLAIAFGSVNATVALLRMGADPSIRPNIEKIMEEQKEQPEDSKVEIPNIQRFDGVSAWELTFGNKAFENAMTHNQSKSWTLFGTSSSSLKDSSRNGQLDVSTRSERMIKPVDMTPSKREGVRHAFTAEALRSVGGDEIHRLRQLLDSGMPATIDIGGKDLYRWAVEMGALQCEEFLRPMEAAKYKNEDGKESSTEGNKSSIESQPGVSTEKGTAADNEGSLGRQHGSFVVHRPAGETVPQLNNRLDELDSLAAALSTCLDNLAEEVSVCHGLLLLGGGASALASHVKSLKALKSEKQIQLEDEKIACQDLERDLAGLVHSSDEIAKEVSNKAAFHLFSNTKATPTVNITDASKVQSEKDDEMVRKALLAQVAASENKVRTQNKYWRHSPKGRSSANYYLNRLLRRFESFEHP
jgi:hypothetical protein